MSRSFPTVLIAPNAFKGSLSALEAARAFRNGVRSVLPGARAILMPISDGGDGLMDVLLAAKGGRRIPLSVRGPLGERRRACFGLTKDGSAIVEMALASGLALIDPSQRDPLAATSYGTGQLIDAALKSGARRIIIGMGGSATNDGGAGMAQALGCRLLDKGGRDIEPGAKALLGLERIELGGLRRRLAKVKVVAVSDVSNPLLGPRGSARVYGPQKGATPAMVKILDKALARYAALLKRDLGADVARHPGAGAAGGLGAGVFAFLNGEIVPGAEYILREVGAPRLLKDADAALTGEGWLDRTSFYGKAPIALSRKAHALGVPVALVCAGSDFAVGPRLKAAGILAVSTFSEAGARGRASFSRAKVWAERASASAIKKLLLAAVACALLGGLPSPARAGAAAALAEADRLYFHRDQDQNLERSLVGLEELARQEPDSSAVLWRWGRGLIRLGERRERKKERLALFEQAEEKLKRAVALKPDEAEAHFWLGVAMGRRGQTRGILNSLFLVGPIRRQMQETLRIDPRYGGAHHVLGEILMQLPRLAGGSKKAAVKELEEAVRLSPEHSANYPSLAEAYIATGQRERARAVLNELLALSAPADPANYVDDAKQARELLRTLGP